MQNPPAGFGPGSNPRPRPFDSQHVEWSSALVGSPQFVLGLSSVEEAHCSADLALAGSPVRCEFLVRGAPGDATGPVLIQNPKSKIQDRSVVKHEFFAGQHRPAHVNKRGPARVDVATGR